jgi:hypothetical protein
MDKNQQLIRKLINAKPGDVFKFIANTDDSYDYCEIEVISIKQENPTWTSIYCKPFGIEFWTDIDIYQYHDGYCVRFWYFRMRNKNKAFCLNSIDYTNADFYLTPWIEAYKQKYQDLLDTKAPHESFDILIRKSNSWLMMAELKNIIEGLKSAYKAMKIELEGAELFKKHKQEAD